MILLPDKSGISIHKALAGLDHTVQYYVFDMCYFNPQGPRGPRPSSSLDKVQIYRFQSTRPSRASTYLFKEDDIMSKVSINKALAGRDLKTFVPFPDVKNYNPQGPRGPRLSSSHLPSACLRFQSTRPSRASTTRARRLENGNCISIHKALAGLDGSHIGGK